MGSKLKIQKVSPLLFIFNLSAEIKNQAAGKIRCFFDCLLTGESSGRDYDVIMTSLSLYYYVMLYSESEFLIYSKRIQAIAVTSYVLTKFCFSSDAGLPDYAKRAPKFRIKVSVIKFWHKIGRDSGKNNCGKIEYTHPVSYRPVFTLKTVHVQNQEFKWALTESERS